MKKVKSLLFLAVMIFGVNAFAQGGDINNQTIVMSIPDGLTVITGDALTPFYCDKTTIFHVGGQGVFIEKDENNTYSIVKCNNGTTEYRWINTVKKERECTAFEETPEKAFCYELIFTSYKSSDGKTWELED